MTRNPASARAGTWLRHSRPESGNPCSKITGRPCPVTSYSMPASPVSTRTNPSLTVGHDGQQLGAVRGRDRLVAPPGAQSSDLVEQARAGRHVSRPVQQHRDGDEAPQAVGVLEGGTGHSLADLPAGIAEPVLVTVDQSIDLRQPVPVARQRIAVPGLDRL